MPLSSARQLNNALFCAGRRYYVDRTSGLLTLIPPSGGTLSASDEVFVSVNDTIVNLVNKKDVTLKDLTSKAPSIMTMQRILCCFACLVLQELMGCVLFRSIGSFRQIASFLLKTC